MLLQLPCFCSCFSNEHAANVSCSRFFHRTFLSLVILPGIYCIAVTDDLYRYKQGNRFARYFTFTDEVAAADEVTATDDVTDIDKKNALQSVA